MTTYSRQRSFFLSSVLTASLLVFGCSSSSGVATRSGAEQQAPVTVVASQPAVDSVPDTVRAGRYDNGKMWTFEYPPVSYLAETYNFRPDSAWFARARLSALRISGCSASFVSPNGLIVTNHHCARSSVSKVTRPGENLLDNGFYAASLEEERPVEGFYADQLIAIEDVTDEVGRAVEAYATTAERAQAREQVIGQIGERIAQMYGGEDAGIQVQVISLYQGGRYSAYVFRRYTNVRLVAAPELQLGFFGGDADNFTYPRYDLDFAFFRIYDDEGQPLQTDHYFTWSTSGVEAGDFVFVIGNPGSTSRLETVAQLTHRRDVEVGPLLQFFNSRIAALEAYSEESPEEAEAGGTRNFIFSLSNSQKAYGGRQSALNDPFIMARRADTERQFRKAIQDDSDLRARYGGLLDRMADLQRQKSAFGDEFAAFLFLQNPRLSSSTLQRALLAYQYLLQREQGGSEVDALEQRLLAVPDQPRGINERLLSARFSDFRQYFGDSHEITQKVLQGRTPEAAAGAVLDNSVLAEGEAAAQALESGTLTLADPAVQVAQAIMDRYVGYVNTMATLGAEEAETAALLGRARFDVYGTAIPPDATFSPRITDGVVKGYEYNGTLAPPYTTFYGLYDRYHSFGPETYWNLPQRWLDPSLSFNRATPLNFISTSDTIGGNSGSPVVNDRLEIVGLNFDRNIEGLSRDFIYLPERGRNIAVDVRAIREALDNVYDADRIVLELTTGRMVATEQEADAQ